MRAAISEVALIAIAAAACGAPPLRPRPDSICHQARAQPSESEPTTGEWIALFARHDERVDGCDDILARTPPPITACEGEDPPPLPELGAMAPELVFHLRRPAEPDVVWIATARSADGRVRGPIAIVERTELGLEVIALGWYLGARHEIEARLYRAGGAWVIGIESQSERERSVELLVQAGGALVVAALEEPDGTCSSPARVTLHREETRPAADGWALRSVRSASVRAEDGALLVEEHVTVREVDPERPDVPPRASHDADKRRRLRPRGGRLLVDRPGLGVLEPGAER